MRSNSPGFIVRCAIVILCGCGSATSTSPADALAVDLAQEPDVASEDAADPDTTDPDTIELDGIAPDAIEPDTADLSDAHDPADALHPADTSDIGPDVIVPPVPVACEPGTACGERLDADGLCAGSCIPQPFGLDCDGVILGGLCFTGPPPPTGVDLAGTTDTVEWSVAIPALGATLPTDLEVAVGDTVTIAFTGVNPSAKSSKVDVFLDVSGRWTVEQSDLASGSLTIAAGATATFTATLRAVQSNAVEPWEWRVATAYLGQRVITLFGRVAYDAGVGMTCGERDFPATYCPTGECTGPMGGFYVSAVCCEGVFYPGSLCCTDADCYGAHCVDGRCLTETPTLSMANDAPIGRLRALLVITDDDTYAGLDPCTDQATTLVDALGLAGVEAWYDQVSAARTGRDLLDIDWVVLAGLHGADFASDPYGDTTTFLADLEAHLDKLGCPQRFEQFDKVVAVTPTVNILGATAVALDNGKIVSRTAADPLILAHEFGHTFGASDVYLDLGAVFRYRADLMGNNMGGFGPPRDGVLRGEIGFVDLNGNGVVDVAEFADAPDSLELLAPRAVAQGKGTLEVSFEIAARQGDEVLRVVKRECTLEVVGLLPQRAVADAKQRKIVVVEPVASAGQPITVRVTASYTFTTPSGARKTITLDQSADLVVEAP